ncbi:unnamed protein product [Caenorhabditis angaria]|uniref:Uncharacterized protein n=1 Tax=Caenorhabditis angaria TaxID=860376 RepID=A0A9P1J0D1_9PELO|nr:unnamed protein product [Caenorhabditis angaria]
MIFQFSEAYLTEEIHPPHCTKTPIFSAEMSRNPESQVRGEIRKHFHIGLHMVICFRLYEGSRFLDGVETTPSQKSYLHTIRWEKLEHHHPISQRYTFGIPEVYADCICECDSTSRICTSKSHQYKTCAESDESTSCYRTFFPNQIPIGCSENDSPKLCCDVKFKPYKNLTFTAVKLEQPSTYATFVYTAYDFENGKWVEKDKTRIRNQLDGGTQDTHLDSAKRISLAVTAERASHQLETGMYFTRKSVEGEIEELRRQPLNEISDNNFDCLGWYRMDKNGKFQVNNGSEKINEFHKANVENCKDQKYRSYLSAKYYMPGNFSISPPVEDYLNWIKTARIYKNSMAREAIVTLDRGNNLHISLNLNENIDGNHFEFFHNSSKIRDFLGTIIVDSRSNRFFNVTVYGASGIIDGMVKYSTENNATNIYTFTTYVSDLTASNRSMIIPLPAIVENGPRMICMKADEIADQNAICRVIQYHESPLEIDLIEGKWHEMIGTCPTCNQVNFYGIMKFLNPAYWIKGISSLNDGVKQITELMVYIGVLIILYIIITKIIIPLIRCWVCPMSFCFSFSSSSKSSKISGASENLRRSSPSPHSKKSESLVRLYRDVDHYGAEYI